MDVPSASGLAGAQPPSWTGAAHARNLASAALRMTYRVRAHGAHHVGTSGPLVLVTRGEGVLTGALVHATAPRPVHVLVNEAMMTGVPEGVLRAAGDIPLSGPGAVLSQQQALAALRDERAVLVAGAAVSPAYLVAASGARIVPVVLVGADGRVPTDPPRPRSRIDIFYTDPVSVDVPGDPLNVATRAAVAERIRQELADAEEQVARRVVWA